MAERGANGTLTAVPGVRVGHAQDSEARTGVTVARFDRPAEAVRDARGGWVGTFEGDALDLGRVYTKRHAIFLTGGDIYGYDAARGIRAFLLERGIAHYRRPGEEPSISGANIYDLDFADTRNVSYEHLGRVACEAAARRPVAQGNVGAGTGATVGKLAVDGGSTKGGVGSAAMMVGPVVVGAVVVVNAVGNVHDPATGELLAGTRRRGGGTYTMDDLLARYLRVRGSRGRATTIGIVATNVAVPRESLQRMASIAHNGIALAVRPAAMATDGDTLFGVSTERLRRRVNSNVLDALCHMATQAVARSIVNAVRAAESLGGVPGLAGD